MITQEIEQEWEQVLDYLEKAVGKRPADLNSVLFLIGVQELGRGTQTFTKEQKQDLMHIAICKVLSYSGYYELVGTDQDGWPHWRLVQKVPHIDLLSQESFLKAHVIRYFNDYLDPSEKSEAGPSDKIV
ncbi:hypothetical protein LX87_03152 [Larkinella arboricola]|uniref:Uncharacterized protein n=1 Tax=Larkinella arboricola TaxID=643671 RepID=A0A327WY03_LARAB|nr:hypothetical protein [Larkinella arboricola]RAJ98242.1 hypothetical protein LX87_03152 [Larkinella arboricola]